MDLPVQIPLYKLINLTNSLILIHSFEIGTKKNERKEIKLLLTNLLIDQLNWFKEIILFCCQFYFLSQKKKKFFNPFLLTFQAKIVHWTNSNPTNALLRPMINGPNLFLFVF